ncbi:hypothetical protein [Rubrobacter marinus]|nr:hypothetical protein [Rubrobacter marinus]
MSENGGRKVEKKPVDAGAAWRGLISLGMVCTTVVAIVWIVWG